MENFIEREDEKEWFVKEKKWAYEQEMRSSKSEIDEPCRPNFTAEEEGYRRGFAHGFSTARHQPHVTESDVSKWRNSHEAAYPPGSPLEGQSIPGTIVKL